MFGSLWKEKTLEGEVISSSTEKGDKVKRTFIPAKWAVGRKQSISTLLLRNVKAGSCPLPRDSNGSIMCHGRDAEPDYSLSQAAPTSDDPTVRALNFAEDDPVPAPLPCQILSPLLHLHQK